MNDKIEMNSIFFRVKPLHNWILTIDLHSLQALNNRLNVIILLSSVG